ncbi:exo-alpha-sialidase [Halomonas sp. ML-15]|uniref:exo-alpha-sialidase n=1 Tax=Halomonas sp. ML-15 TaxID=2773305 RepID=UPI0017474EAD|nr:exo-alpha-sialidase [Halomonas sp. ML-15]MBD3895839.1 exo-alpha-sialidase [Halomonas sp. ML-15]
MTYYRWLLAVAVLVTLLAGCSREPSGISLEQLREQTHIHGLAFNRSDSEQLWLATHHGFYAVGRDGMARRVSEETHDFMGFAPHPEDGETFFASGHPARGGNLGVVKSSDAGRSWSRHASGVDGPVDFHQMTISPASPSVLYGAYGGQLQVSHDGGASWQVRAKAPAGLIALAASSRDPDQLYAATQTGLLMSPDGGERWRQIFPERRPASLVVASQGELYAFMIGGGLLRAEEGNRDWEVVKRGWGERYLLHLAVDPNDPQRLLVADDQGHLLLSANGGRDWSPLE